MKPRAPRRPRPDHLETANDGSNPLLASLNISLVVHVRPGETVSQAMRRVLGPVKRPVVIVEAREVESA